MDKQTEQVGIINEIGDLGLGFEPISEEDAKKINEQDNK